MDITGVLLSAVTVMYAISAPRGSTKYHSLAFGLFLASLNAFYGYSNGEWLYYTLSLLAAAKAWLSYRRWSR
jgi:hypothetical protein